MRVSPALWRAFKSKAAAHGLTIREALEALIRAWLESRVDLPPKK